MSDAVHLFDGDDAPAVPPGHSLLVTAAGEVGERVVTEFLRTGIAAGESAVAITTDGQASAVETALEAASDDGSLASEVRVIDAEAAAAEAGVDDDDVGREVNTPRNLTDIGIAFKDALDEFEDDRLRFGLLSLSVVLSYVDQETTYRFCQTLTRALDQEGSVGLFQLNTDLHDDATVGTLRRAFDGVLEVDEGDDGTEIRVTGVEGVDETWYRLPE